MGEAQLLNVTLSTRESAQEAERMTDAQNRADIEYLSLLDLTYRVVQAL